MKYVTQRNMEICQHLYEQALAGLQTHLEFSKNLSEKMDRWVLEDDCEENVPHEDVGRNYRGKMFDPHEIFAAMERLHECFANDILYLLRKESSAKLDAHVALQTFLKKSAEFHSAAERRDYEYKLEGFHLDSEDIQKWFSHRNWAEVKMQEIRRLQNICMESARDFRGERNYTLTDEKVQINFGFAAFDDNAWALTESTRNIIRALAVYDTGDPFCCPLPYRRLLGDNMEMQFVFIKRPRVTEVRCYQTGPVTISFTDTEYAQDFANRFLR